MPKPVVKLLIVLCLHGLLLQACDASLSESDDALSAPLIGMAQNDAMPARLISVYLKPQQDFAYTPLFGGRIVVAESVSMVPVTLAKGTVLTAGIDVVHVGESCEVLQSTYPELRDCEEQETAEFHYGAVASTAVFNADGYALLTVDGGKKYRLRVKSWATEEDARCFWGGQGVLDSVATELTVPVLVFCE